LTKRSEALEKQIVENRNDAEKREAGLEERLKKALAALHASEGRGKKLEAANKGLLKHIAKGLREDVEREQKHKEHDEADHKANNLANEALKEAQAVGKHLKEELESKNKTIAELEACLDATKCQLQSAEDKILRLKEALSAEEKEKAELKEQFDVALHKLQVAERDLGHLRTENANLKTVLKEEKEMNAELENKLEQALGDLKKSKQEIVNLGKKIEKKDADMKRRDAEITEQDDKIASLRIQLKETEETNKEQGEMYAATRTARDTAETKVESLKKELRALRASEDIKSDVQVSMTEITV
jgi:chromosome segregation ATPase